MKIWWQSEAMLGIDPAWNDYVETLKNCLSQVARSDTEVVVHGAEASSPMISKSHFVELLVKPQFVKAAIRAKQEGYDVFCAGNTLDLGHYEIREVVDIPVCFLSETSVYLASLLGCKFAILAYSKAILIKLTELIKRYGLRDKLVPSHPLDITSTDIQQAFNNPQIILNPAQGVAKEAIQNGAGMLLPSSGVINMILRKHGITEIAGVPVLEGSGALIKMAETMVDLAKIDIKRSKLAFPPITKDELVNIQRTFSGINLI